MHVEPGRANSPTVAGNLRKQLHHAGEQKVLINPADAATRGIAPGDVVRVYNDRGSFDAAADVSADTMAGIVVAPMGYWARRDGNGRTVNAINPPAFADYGNAPTFSDTLVEVAKHAWDCRQKRRQASCQRSAAWIQRTARKPVGP